MMTLPRLSATAVRRAAFAAAGALALSAAAPAPQDMSLFADDAPPPEEWASQLKAGQLEPRPAADRTGAKRVNIIFEGYLLGLRVGKMSLTAYMGPDEYEVHSLMRTAGVAALITNTQQRAFTVGGFEDGAVEPVFHAFTDRKKGETPQFVELTYDEGENRVGMWSQPQRRMRHFVGPEDIEGAVDPMSGLVQVGMRLAGASLAPCGQTAKIFDGRRRYDLRLEPVDLVELRDRDDRYNGRAYRCRVRYEQLAGFKPDVIQEDTDRTKAYMYFADFEGGVRLPVRAEVHGRFGGLTLIARDIRVQDWEPEAAG